MNGRNMLDEDDIYSKSVLAETFVCVLSICGLRLSLKLWQGVTEESQHLQLQFNIYSHSFAYRAGAAKSSLLGSNGQ